MKTVLIVGCHGVIGRQLVGGLGSKYNIIGCDIADACEDVEQYYKCDASDFDQLEPVFSKHKIDAVINLSGIKEMPCIPTLDDYKVMVDTYLNSTFMLLMKMRDHNVKKMVLASTNHVTDRYEEDGYSTLGREISPLDYPISKSVYGTLKLAAEGLCRNFNINYGIQTVALRIGTYRESYDPDDYQDRWDRTRLDTEDMLLYFEKAIEVECEVEVCYLVSENKDKPWDTSTLKKL